MSDTRQSTYQRMNSELLSLHMTLLSPDFPPAYHMTNKTKTAFDWEQTRVKKLFAFLEKNTVWNREFQQRDYKRCLASCTTDRDRLVSFLHLNVNTQSGADMNGLRPFWELLHRATPAETSSLKAFTTYVGQRAEELPQKKGRALANPAADDWELLFDALNSYRGWGTKTTALFVKASINLHRGPKELHFWSDASPEFAPLKSTPRLPVDRVILRIFEELHFPSPRIDNINTEMRSRYTGEQMLTWDDLWFWGFFTQTVKDKDRILGWNSGKFWNQLSSPKDREVELRALGEEFVQLLR